MEPAAPSPWHRPKFVPVLTLVTLLVVLLMVGAALIGTIQAVSRLSSRPARDPLGSYPEQTTDKLSYAAGDDIIVQATKCADENVRVTGSQNWVSVDPPGIGVPIAIGAAAGRDKGCKNFEYRNPMPLSITETVIRLGQPIRVFISGVETPFDESDPTRIGVPRAWHTNVFTIEPT